MPETRLIDVNEVRLIESDSDAYIGEWNDDYEKGFDDAIHKVMELPTVDAVSVKRGHWITTQKTIDDNITTCSNCKREFYIENLVEVGNEDGYCEFCPSCGADMREVTNADS